MRHAIIEAGSVVNIVVADPAHAATKGWVEAPDHVGIGWEYDGEDWIAPEVEPVPVTPDMVDAERDRRIAAGFSFGGKVYQSRPDDRENISGASIAALAAIGAGAQPGDYRWHGGDSDFVWIATDNSLTVMDAQTMFAFGQAAMAHKQAHIFAARAIKDAEPIPADYADGVWWP